VKKIATLLVCAMVGFSLAGVEALARGGGGGARGGGGGGARAGGGGMAGGAGRAAPAANRSPSMSRAGPSMGGGGGMARPSQMPAARPGGTAQRPATRPTQPIQRPTPGTLPARPGGGQAQRPAGGARPSTLPATRPTQGQLGNFLNMPSGSTARPGAIASGGRPTQLPATGGSFGKTVTGPGGGQITVGGKGGSRTGPGGGTIGAGAAGIKVTGPGGNSYTKVAGGAAIRGPGGNTVAAGRGASFVNGQFVGGRSWAAVNGSFTRWNSYGPGWNARYPGCWWPGRWAAAGTIWAATTWALAGSYCGCSGEPVYYDYGDNVVYEGDNVYYGDQPVATAEQYYQQAGEIAASAEESQNDDWLPLGVFGVVKEGEESTEKLVQLAVNKDGVIRGNYHDLLADKVTPVSGAVDKETQRVALKLEGNDAVVVETALYNLTNDEVSVLVHFGADRQEPRLLVRLQQPESQGE